MDFNIASDGSLPQLWSVKLFCIVVSSARDNLHRVQARSRQREYYRHAGEIWTSKNVLVLIFFASFLTIQIVVPIIKLTSQRPARFGWQMWSARKKFPRFFVVMKDGTSQPADLSRYIGWSRGEIDLTEALPPHLCRVVPEIAAVQVKEPGSETLKVHSCR